MIIRNMVIIVVTTLFLTACDKGNENAFGGSGSGSSGGTSQATVGVITQITNGDATIGSTYIEGLTDDGRYAAVRSNHDLAGTRGGATTDYPHLYVIDLTTNVATQIGDDTELVSTARIAADGSKIAYTTYAEELKTADLDGSNILMITDIESTLFELSSDGQWIFIEALLEETATTKQYGIVKIPSTAALVTTTLVLTNPPTSPYDNIVWDFNIASLSSMPSVSSMRVSSDGTTLIFQSNYDLFDAIPAVFADELFQLYSVKTDGTNRAKVTSIDPAVAWHDENGSLPTYWRIEYPDISSDGSFAVFNSRFDLVGTNSANKAVPYRVDLVTGDFTQLLDESVVKDVSLLVGVSSAGMLSGDDQSIVFDHLSTYKGSSSNSTSLTELIGSNTTVVDATPNYDARTIIFVSPADLTGENPDKNDELFMLKL